MSLQGAKRTVHSVLHLYSNVKAYAGETHLLMVCQKPEYIVMFMLYHADVAS